MLQKFLPTIFAIRHDQCVVAALRTVRRRTLLLRLLMLISALVQAVDSYYELHRRFFGRQQHSKNETPERAADWRYADHHDMVSLRFP